MKNWIYLIKTNTGFDDIKAVALASVLWHSPHTYNVVRTNTVSIYFKGLVNVNVGSPCEKDGDVTSELNLPDNAPFGVLCKLAAEALELDAEKTYKPYLGFSRNENEIDRQLANKEDIALFCYYTNEREQLLVSILESVVEELNHEQITPVCCGSRREHLLRGAYDFRELIQIDEIIKNRARIKVLVTSTFLVKEIGCALGISVIYLYSYAIIVYNNDGRSVISMRPGCVDELTNTIKALCTNSLEHNHQNSVPAAHKKFEVPYNFDEEIIPYYAHYASCINFLFLPPYSEDTINTRTCLESSIKGRSYMPQSRKEYEWHIRLIKASSLNFVVLWQDRTSLITSEMLDYYSKLGASGFIIANDANAKIIKEYNPRLLVISSIVQRLCAGMSSRDFTYYDYVVMFYPFTRSLNGLKKLSALKDKIVIMPNSMCHTDCPGLHHWFAKDIHSFERSSSCPAVKDESRSTFIKPEHLTIFDDLVGGYKLQGREWSADYIVSICEAYFHRTTLKHLITDDLLNTINDGLSRQGVEAYYNIKTEEIIDIL